MIAAIRLIVIAFLNLLKSQTRLEAENLVLRHQLNVALRKAPRRLGLTNADRALFVWLYRLCPSVLNALAIMRPETVIRWQASRARRRFVNESFTAARHRANGAARRRARAGLRRSAPRPRANKNAA